MKIASIGILGLFAIASVAMTPQDINLVTDVAVQDDCPDRGALLRLVYDEQASTLRFAFYEGQKPKRTIDYPLYKEIWGPIKPQGLYLLKNHILGVAVSKSTNPEIILPYVAHIFVVERNGSKRPNLYYPHLLMNYLFSPSPFSHFNVYDNEPKSTITIEAQAPGLWAANTASINYGCSNDSSNWLSMKCKNVCNPSNEID